MRIHSCTRRDNDQLEVTLFHGGIYQCIILPTTHVKDGKTVAVRISEAIVREVVNACDSLMQHAHAEDREAVESAEKLLHEAHLNRNEAEVEALRERLARLGIR